MQHPTDTRPADADAVGAPLAEVHPVILAGGSGTRLWPLSRKSRPKQFASVLGDATPLPVLRPSRSGRRAPGASRRHGRGLPLRGDGAARRRRHRAGSRADRALRAKHRPGRAGRRAPPGRPRPRGDGLLVVPSDHAIPDDAGFRAAVARGVAAAREGRLVTFGIRPDRPETGYGYLELSDASETEAAQPLRGFVEKPDAETAARLVSGGGHLWNAGIFLFRAAALIAAAKAHAPHLLPPVRDALTGAKADLGFLRMDATAWDGVEDISIDHAIMERADTLSVVPYDGRWSDLGDWQAIWREGDASEDGARHARRRHRHRLRGQPPARRGREPGAGGAWDFATSSRSPWATRCWSPTGPACRRSRRRWPR